MSEISNQQSAVSNQRPQTQRMPVGCAEDHWDLSPLLNADCRLLIAGLPNAIPCTVTHPYTSVTTLALVESGLIIVGRANGRWAETAANRGLARAAHCSFQGGMCIQ